MQKLRTTLARASQSPANVLITGETGTGKEIAARMLRGKLPDGTFAPFIAVDSATIQEKEVSRLGASRLIPLSFRVIAATNKDLNKMMKAGEFQKDLFSLPELLIFMRNTIVDDGVEIFKILEMVLHNGFHNLRLYLFIIMNRNITKANHRPHRF